MFHYPEKNRRQGFAKEPGAFVADFESFMLRIIASNEDGWEHVSVSLPKRCPNWREMCYIKGLFWDEGDRVVQYHPPKENYINCHPFCLHMWRPIGVEIPMPPYWMVGFKSDKQESPPTSVAAGAEEK